MSSEITNALLGVQNALLGVVTPELRAVDVAIDDKHKIFKLTFIYDGEVSGEILELWSSASTEASCYMPLNYKIEEQYIRLDFPKEIPCKGRFAYLRKE